MSTSNVKQETVDYMDEDKSSCLSYMYPSKPFVPSEYVNQYDNKGYMLEQLKTESLDNGCPSQSHYSINNKMVSENKELLKLKDKQEIKHENRGERLSLNIKEEDEDVQYQFTLETHRLEQQGILNNGGHTAVHYDVLATPQEVQCKLCDKTFKNSMQQPLAIGDIIKEPRNEHNKSDHRQTVSARLNNKGALRKERDRRYRDKNQERINQRRRDNRQNRQNLQLITTCLNVNSLQPLPLDEASSKRAEKDTRRRERDRKYRERHREEINQRRKERRRLKQYMHQIATAPSVDKIQENTEAMADQRTSEQYLNMAKDITTQNLNNRSQRNAQYSEERAEKDSRRRERDRKYRERHREEINQRRKERRRLKLYMQQVTTSPDLQSVEKIQENDGINYQQSSESYTNLNIAKDADNFNNRSLHNTIFGRNAEYYFY